MNDTAKALERAKVLLAQSGSTVRKYGKAIGGVLAKAVAFAKDKITWGGLLSAGDYASYAVRKISAIAGKRQFWALAAGLTWGVANLGYCKAIEAGTWLAYQGVNLTMNLAARICTAAECALVGFPVDLVNRLRGIEAPSVTEKVIAKWTRGYEAAVEANTYLWNAVRKVTLAKSFRSTFFIISGSVALEVVLSVLAGTAITAAVASAVVPFLVSMAWFAAVCTVLYILEDQFGLISKTFLTIGKAIAFVMGFIAIPFRALGDLITDKLQNRRARKEAAQANADLLAIEIEMLKIDLAKTQREREEALEAALLFEQAATEFQKQSEGRTPKPDSSKRREKRGSGNPAKREAVA